MLPLVSASRRQPRPHPGPPLASLLAVLPVVGLALLQTALKHLFPTLQLELGMELLATVPVLCGALAAGILLRRPTPRRPEFWKCSIWVWTWLLLAMVLCGSGLEVIILFPYFFFYHFVFIGHTALGVEFGKFAIDIQQGRIRLPWVKPAWYLLVVGLLGTLLLVVVVLLVHRQR